MTKENISSPATWRAADVIAWANQAKLTPDVLASLASNEVDGPTLLTLTKQELRSELGISSLPARRFLWELIKSLKSEQATCDYSAAIEIHRGEIQSFSDELKADNRNQGPDAASGNGRFSKMQSMPAVVDELVVDVQKQRQVIEDRLLAFRVQRALHHGQDICKDAEVAHEEQERLNRLLAQEESDRELAASLARGRERMVINRRQRTVMRQDSSPDTQSQEERRVSSLFGMCVQSCSNNKINVQEAFLSGKVKPMTNPATVSDEESSRDDEDDDRKPAAVNRNIFNLPFISQCSVCYEENIKGYNLVCGRHHYCVQCMRKLFRTALRDNKLIPLVCCEAPIDMNIAKDLLDPNDATLILNRLEEKKVRNKMYCPSCAVFINLDLVDSTQSSVLICECGTSVCTICKTSSHPGYSCRQNQAIHSGSDELILELSREQGWKQCPKCSMIIELRSGCNHMTCVNCDHEFCYKCLREWDKPGARCSSRTCELWDEDRLVEAGEARVRQEEAARGRRLAEPVRRERLREAIVGLRANEICDHEWVRSRGYKGDCPNCGFTMYAYGMHCRSDCGSTVCYTCAHHRIPNRGWR